MKIIDKKSGKRIDKHGEDVKTINKKLKEVDPIIKNAVKDSNIKEMSAMDPPDAYDKESTIGLDYENANLFIRELIDEHEKLTDELKLFDDALLKFKQGHYTFNIEVSEAFNRFYKFFDEHILPHNQKEEKDYFRILHKRLIESGESGSTSKDYTAIDIMEDDHVKFIQLASISFNLLGLAHRLPDMESKAITFDLAFNTARELVELLRLHIFRENETLFPLSMKLLTEDDFKIINEE